MGRILKFESPTKFSKMKKSVTPSEKLSPFREWRRQRSRSSVEMDLLTSLPVPTVPPYPIEYFQDNENGLAHINLAFQFSEDCLPSSVSKEERFQDFSSHQIDSDSKGSSYEDSRDSTGSSTTDSGVVLNSRSISRRTSGVSQEFRTSPDGRAERECFPERLTPSSSQQRHSTPPPPYSTLPIRPVPRVSMGGYPIPISNGTLKRNTDARLKTSNSPCIPKLGENTNRNPVPIHRPSPKISTLPPRSSEHTYVNRPSKAGFRPIDDRAPPPYPGGSKLEYFPPPLPPPPPSHQKVDPPPPLPHLGSQIRSQLWQTSSAPRPCGRSKSVHDETRKSDTFRSRLGSINTLGIPYIQTTLPPRLPKKYPPIVIGKYRKDNGSNQTNKPDIVLTVPISKFKNVVAQPRSPFKKSIIPVYSKINKQRKPKKQPSTSNTDNASTNLLPNSRNNIQNYSSVPQQSTLQKPEKSTTSPNTKKDSTVSPLYEELVEFQDGEDEVDNSTYSIEVRIDYSKGTKYKVERRRRRSNSEGDKNNNETEKKSEKSKLNTSIHSDKMKQFRRDKKSSFCDKLLKSDDSSKSRDESMLSQKNKFWSTLCCCRNVKRYVHQPGRIENYIPGYSSLSEKELRSAKSQNPPRTSTTHRYNGSRMHMSNALKESGYESDSTLVFRKQGELRRQDDRSVSELYRQIQRGGDVPLEGLRKPAPRKPKEPEIGPLPFPYLNQGRYGRSQADSPFKYENSEVNIHYKTPVRMEQKETIPDDELVRRQEEHMQKVYEQERRKKYLSELEDIERRRHTDNWTPLHRSPIPLNRYDEETQGGKKGRQIARALFTFNAQNKRELSFTKGDIITVRRAIDKNWQEGEIRGIVGIFPSNYVEMLSSDKSQPRKGSEGQARARFAFQAQTSMEMSLSKGEMVVLTRRVDENWYEGRIGQRKGIFPVSYVDVLVEPTDKGTSPSCSPLPRPALPNNSAYNGGVTSASSAYSTLSGGTTNGVVPAVETKTTSYNQQLTVNTQQESVPYRALYNYKPQNEDELELREGDIVMVMEKCDDGWYVGTSRRTSLFGTFPGNYVDRA